MTVIVSSMAGWEEADSSLPRETQSMPSLLPEGDDTSEHPRKVTATSPGSVLLPALLCLCRQPERPHQAPTARVGFSGVKVRKES